MTTDTLMLGFPPGTRVWLASGRTDMRGGFDGLSAQVQVVLKEAPLPGHVVVFRGRSGDLVKVLWYDGQGMCLLYKRSFVWPTAKDGKVRVSPAQLATLLERIAELYQIEREIRGAPPDTRKTVRQAKAKPLFEDLQQWLEDTLMSVPGRSELAKVIRYAITRMRRMTPYLENGRCALDNNAAERSLRGIALGKKNFLFAGSDKGGERATAIYSLIATAKLNNVNPQAWLTHVLKNIADHPVNIVSHFLPWNFEKDKSQ